MKQLLFITAAILLALATGCRTISPEEKAAQYARDSLAHAQAVYCLEHSQFMLQARSVVVKGKRMPIVDNETNNFVCAHDSIGIVQLVADMSDAARAKGYSTLHPLRMYQRNIGTTGGGPNGIGGITVKGKITLLSKKVEKSGRIIFKYEIASMPQKMKFTINLPKNGTYAEALIVGERRSGDVKMLGEVRPYDPSGIAIGSSW